MDRISGPDDVKALKDEELSLLAEEVRWLIIETVAENGGHLSPNLGVVELTIALLRIFDPPADKLVWDVSHQTYPYKILTGRKEMFGSLRQYGGISGFSRRAESPYDCYGAGHSGTAASAALGMAVARDREGTDENVVAIVGDGSIGCGISLEALNNVSGTTRRLILILNDNEMSIAANVGAVSKYLGSLLASPRYNRWKKAVESVATRMRMGWLRSAYYRIEETLKGLFLRSMIFEELGLRYVGPVDGHDMRSLTDALTIARNSDRPILVHVSTQKGRGYAFAEKEPEKWHSASRFDIESGEPSGAPSLPGYSSVFGRTLVKIGEKDNRVVAISAAMTLGTGLSDFAEKFPGRFFDVGISEEHGMVFAAGLAAGGLRPVFAVYSTFVQRAVDCVIHDVCLQDLPVVICLDRAGVVGGDGPTHHGIFDIALFRPVPGLTIMQGRDEKELANMLFTAVSLGKPCVLRYPRGQVTGVGGLDDLQKLEIGKAEIVREPARGMSPDGVSGRRVWIWALGDMVAPATEAADILEKDGVITGVVNARFVRPLDAALLREHARNCELIAVLENGIVTGGFGTAMQEEVEARGGACRVLRLGWPDSFVPHGDTSVLKEKFGLTPGGIAGTIAGALRK
ncbi:MAG: 1-deoxy-D-xylulose-5-phosphate synthase [Kiritimatiellia bacterium]